MERCFFVWQNGGDGENKKGTSISTFRNLRVLFDFYTRSYLCMVGTASCIKAQAAVVKRRLSNALSL